MSENLARKYAVSDAATLEVIRRCGAVGGAPVPGPPAPGPTGGGLAVAANLTTRLVKGSGPAVYLVHAGKRYGIPDPDTFIAMGLDWAAIQAMDDGALAQLAEMAVLPHMIEGALGQGERAGDLPAGAQDAPLDPRPGDVQRDGPRLERGQDAAGRVAPGDPRGDGISQRAEVSDPVARGG